MANKVGLYQNVSESDFVRAFENRGRGNQFTGAGLLALYKYLDELADDIGEPIELDVIALCCEYTEYESLEAFQNDYPDTAEAIEDINDSTVVIPIDDESFIIQQF